MIEAMIVAFIIIASLLVALAVADRSIHVSRLALRSAQASFILEEGAEAVRIIRDDDWDNLGDLVPSTIYYPLFSGGTWTLSETLGTVDIFTRTVTIEDVYRDDTSGDITSSGGTEDELTKLINVEVSWQEGSNSSSKTMSFYLSDIFGTNGEE